MQKGVLMYSLTKHIGETNMMTRKHFIKLANLIKDNSRMANVRNTPMFVINRHEFIINLCELLKEENPNFDERKFREASGEILSK